MAQDGLSIRSPDDQVSPRLWREQKRESSPPPPQQQQQQPRDCPSSGVQVGAHVARGSDVVFVFHFGDGSSQRVEPAGRASQEGTGSMTQSAASAVVTHHYKRGGRFSVSVTASNPLGSVTRLIDRSVYVGSPAEGLTLEPSDYAVVAAGRRGSFRAALRRGANATVDWELRSVRRHHCAGWAAACQEHRHHLRARVRVAWNLPPSGRSKQPDHRRAAASSTQG
ncbi:uncharacterized protein LOC125939688 [Dermacentor silvarum]|uniref:uncharacterized protein LOC125939688 n=1 Tax=Dermacentor silvarum TaxID=543639 RepID=UPI00189A3758|nr:uncharacterized protein LOC125939688 [Dermacentor silvarum]